MGVSKNRGTPKSSILIRFSIINHPFWDTPILGNTHISSIDWLCEIGAKTYLFQWPTYESCTQSLCTAILTHTKAFEGTAPLYLRYLESVRQSATQFIHCDCVLVLYRLALYTFSIQPDSEALWTTGRFQCMTSLSIRPCQSNWPWTSSGGSCPHQRRSGRHHGSSVCVRRSEPSAAWHGTRHRHGCTWWKANSAVYYLTMSSRTKVQFDYKLTNN